MPGLRGLRDPGRRPGVHAGARHRAASKHRVRRRASAAAAGSPTTWTRTACTASTAARRRSRRASRRRGPTSSVWVVTGDGDALSIGGNHLIHALRRNVNLKILLFNNQIYGLTKGQYSPTSEEGKVTKSTPFGSVDHPSTRSRSRSAPRQPSSRGRSTTTASTSPRCCARPPTHQGTAFVEIYQNCNVFNDGAFDLLRDKPSGAHNQIRLVARRADRLRRGHRCVRLGANGRLVITNDRRDRPRTRSSCTTCTGGRRCRSRSRTCRTAPPSRRASACSATSSATGVRRRARTRRPSGRPSGWARATCARLLHGGDTWTVS